MSFRIITSRHVLFLFYHNFKSVICFVLSFAREFVQEDEKLIPIADKLRKIQLVLIDAVDIVNSIPPKAAPLKGKTLREPTSVAKITSSDISELEALIAHYGTLLPQVERFIVPVRIKHGFFQFCISMIETQHNFCGNYFYSREVEKLAQL